ncbi:hypothetical protein L484_012305 [Morus notabilis]|uniref:Uncharacterized protein n=1 Tax=Morus notabilis TaxID=981085 RepID=W9QCD1_9ROSA|nr:uncharacterized protein LOC21395528 [Morus notabilis]EXB25878.1 hypothetical protein L484_012305 [Morus notabilis]
MPSSEVGNSTTIHDLRKKSFRIKQDDKFFSRLLSKETSQPNSSHRVYYGEAAGAIPFVWESQPGTPKHTLFGNASLPPLTPPPSYANSNKISASKSIHRRSSSSSSKAKLLLLSTIFSGKDVKSSKAKTRKLSLPSSLSSLSSSSTSSSSSWSNYSASSLNKKKAEKRRGWFLEDSVGSIPLDYGSAEYDDPDHDNHATSFRSPNSILCFPVMKKKTWDFLAGCYALGNMKFGRRVL